MSRPPRAKPRPTLRRRLTRWLVLALLLYAGWCAAMYFMQDQLVFPREAAGPVLRESAIPQGIERVWIDVNGGARVEGWFLRPEGVPTGGARGVVIFLHGNAELIDWCDEDARFYQRRGWCVLLPEYRGYGRSGGAPSQAAIVDDVRAFRAWMAQQPGVDVSRTVLHGRSIGAALAAQVAAEAPPAALILESPFTSMTRLAWGYGIPPFVVKHPLQTDRVLPTLSCPILILHSEDDEIIPFEHAEQLRACAPGSTLVRMKGSHNIRHYHNPAFSGAIGALLKRVCETQ